MESHAWKAIVRDVIIICKASGRATNSLHERTLAPKLCTRECWTGLADQGKSSGSHMPPISASCLLGAGTFWILPAVPRALPPGGEVHPLHRTSSKGCAAS